MQETGNGIRTSTDDLSGRVNSSGNENGRTVRDASDDLCPICFGNLSVPCCSNCLHWFCGSCILEYWNYSTVLWPCKCPRCFTTITKLTPRKSSLLSVGEEDEDDDEEEAGKILDGIQRYNGLYSGGLLGIKQKFVESPFLMKRIVRRMMDPDRPDVYLPEIRIVALWLSVFYSSTSLNFIPTGGVSVVRLFDYSAILLVIVLRLVGIYQKRRRTQRVRHLAAAAAEQPSGDEM